MESQLSSSQPMETALPNQENCPVLRALTVLTGKWKLQILWHLKDGSRRYGELRRMIPEVSEKVLIQQLKQLEADGLLTRQVQSSVPPRVDYALTSSAFALGPVLISLGQWSDTHLTKSEIPIVQKTTK